MQISIKDRVEVFLIILDFITEYVHHYNGIIDDGQIKNFLELYFKIFRFENLYL